MSYNRNCILWCFLLFSLFLRQSISLPSSSFCRFLVGFICFDFLQISANWFLVTRLSLCNAVLFVSELSAIAALIWLISPGKNCFCLFCWFAGQKPLVFWRLLKKRGVVIFILIWFSTPISMLIAVCNAWIGSDVLRSKWRGLSVSDLFVVSMSLIIVSSQCLKLQFSVILLYTLKLFYNLSPFRENSRYISKVILLSLLIAASMMVQSSIVVSSFITSFSSLRFKMRLPTAPMLKYNSETHFWSQRLRGRSQESIPASITFWNFNTHETLSCAFRDFLSLSVSSVGFSMGCSYRDSERRLTAFCFGLSNVSRLFPGLTENARFTLSSPWWFWLSFLPKKIGSVVSVVFFNPADCARLYTFTVRIDVFVIRSFHELVKNYIWNNFWRISAFNRVIHWRRQPELYQVVPKSQSSTRG